MRAEGQKRTSLASDHQAGVGGGARAVPVREGSVGR